MNQQHNHRELLEECLTLINSLPNRRILGGTSYELAKRIEKALEGNQPFMATDTGALKPKNNGV